MGTNPDAKAKAARSDTKALVAIFVVAPLGFLLAIFIGWLVLRPSPEERAKQEEAARRMKRADAQDKADAEERQRLAKPAAILQLSILIQHGIQCDDILSPAAGQGMGSDDDAWVEGTCEATGDRYRVYIHRKPPATGAIPYVVKR